MKPSTSVCGLRAICGTSTKSNTKSQLKKLRGALTAGAALTPGLNAEAADETYLTSALSATIRGQWTALRAPIRGALNVGTVKAAAAKGSKSRSACFIIS
jgi:hypothetical protein